ncbi:hypothetical protein [Mucilaginibacter sp.]|uniref:hypothetical protein n=1 Tax=unclassified Mucilaginibacter TaxID=2617802 RepID=UPI0032667058
MSGTNKLPLNLYAEAFGQYAMVQPNTFDIRSKDGQMLVQFGGNVYQVSHFNDLMATYKSYFDIDHSLIYIELPAAIWNIFVAEKIVIDPDNFIIDLYRAWEMIWDKQLAIYDNPQKYDYDKQQSYADFKHLTYEIHKHRWEEVFDIAQIDPVILFPALAMAIKGQYRNELVFYRECVSLMTSEYHDQIGNGFVFEQVNLLQTDDKREIFFIYSVDEQFITV